MQLEVDNYCFACGKENPIGLKLVFTQTESGVSAEFNPNKEHQGFVNIVHGGIITTLLDEAMAHAIIASGKAAVTVRMSVTYKKPTVTGRPVNISGKVVEMKGKIIKASAEISQAGQITALANADFFEMK